MMLAAAGWLSFIWPPLAHAILPYPLLSGLGELALATWLIVKGVNGERWHEMSRREILADTI
jgi:hypothetical protein